MKAFKLDIYRDNELVYSNVYNNNIVSICDHIVSFPNIYKVNYLYQLDKCILII